MKLIIHDLSNEKLENLKSEIEKEDESINIIKKSIDKGSIIIDKDVCVISNNKKIKSRMGCFECWIKTPGKCKIRDGYENLSKLYLKVEKVIIISQCFYGTYSPFVKNI